MGTREKKEQRGTRRRRKRKRRRFGEKPAAGRYSLGLSEARREVCDGLLGKEDEEDLVLLLWRVKEKKYQCV